MHHLASVSTRTYGASWLSLRLFDAHSGRLLLGIDRNPDRGLGIDRKLFGFSINLRTVCE